MNLSSTSRALLTAKQSLKAQKKQIYEHRIHTHQPLSHSIATASLKPQTLMQKHHVFDEIPQLNHVNTNHLLFEYSRVNRNKEALTVFLGIHSSGFFIGGSTLSCVLKVSGCLADHDIGRQVHCLCVKCGLLNDVSVGTSLVDMYMKTDNVKDGRNVFDQMSERNVVSWTSLLVGYSKNGLNQSVLDSFRRMQVEGIKPNPFTFAAVVGALANEKMVEKGIQVHAMVIKSGSEATIYVCNSLISMYLKYGMIPDAKSVFDNMEERNAVTWNCMAAGYITNELDFEAFELIHLMRASGVKLTQSLFVSLIKLCAKIAELGSAKQLHCQILKNEFESDQNIRTALMVAYTKCKKMDDAYKLFAEAMDVQNVVSCTVMINGYLQNGQKKTAVILFRQMNRNSIKPNHYTYSTILKAHPAVSPFQLHTQVIKANYEKAPTVGTALLDAYVKLGNVDEASRIFEIIEEKDIVAWSAMISGYTQVDDVEGAIKLFVQMAKDGIKPNEFTFSSVINACAKPMAAAEQGKQIHACAIKSKFSNTLCVSSALVTMYAKRGNIENANEVFKRQDDRDLVSWNSVISGYAQHGHAKKALKVFEEMRRKNLEMDGITFTGVISACTHVGLVDEGQRHFDMMVKDLGIEPTMEHYSCMVDLYSRAGMLEKAMDLISTMPFPADATVWRTMLSACHVHRNVKLGEISADKLISLQPDDSAAYVLLSNIYAATGNWQEKNKVRSLMNERNIKKEPAYSWIEVKNTTHSFLAGDISHPLSAKIYLKLAELLARVKDSGYRANTSYVLQDIDDEHKEAILSRHSERLAIAFGLIETPRGTRLQIVKNLREDCVPVGITGKSSLKGLHTLKFVRALTSMALRKTKSHHRMCSEVEHPRRIFYG
ncbi:hypothetical protein ACFE04_016498 [Oxalis oulophora]